MLPSILIRLGGLAAMVSGALYVSADLLNLPGGGALWRSYATHDGRLGTPFPVSWGGVLAGLSWIVVGFGVFRAARERTEQSQRER
jgi:hypothetical protein